MFERARWFEVTPYRQSVSSMSAVGDNECPEAKIDTPGDRYDAAHVGMGDV